MFDKQINVTQKNFLLFLYLVILGIFGPAAYWISNNNTEQIFSQKTSANPVEKRFSMGEKILVTAHSNLAKQAGVEAYAKGDYITAQENFNSALERNRNDPEARIYLNNTIAAKTKATYRIGVGVPIGGDLGVAEEILRGVAQAQTEINNKGGIDGKLLTIKIANDDNNPEIALEIADRFVKDSKILAVVGHNTSNTSIAAAPIYQDAGLVMITPTSSAETLSAMGDRIFRTTPSTRALADILADRAVNVEAKTNIGVCIDAESQASTSFQENFTWAVYNYGGKIAPLNCNLSATDFDATQISSEAISSGVDALLVAPSVGKVNKAIEVVTANNDRLTLFGNHSLNTYATLKGGQNAANGMILAVPWYEQSNENEFVRNAEKLWGGSVNWRTAMAYDATQTISQGLVSDTTRKTIQSTIAHPDFTAKGATTEVSFLPSGDRHLKGTLIKIQPGEKSGTGYDFAPLDSGRQVVSGEIRK